MYQRQNVTVSDGQKKKIRESYADGDGVRIQFSYQDLMGGNDIIGLTQSQLVRISNAMAKGKGVIITMSPTQVKANAKMEGGFLGALLGMATRFLPAIAKTVLPALGVGALSGLASSGVQKAMGSGLFLKKGGCVCSVEPDGSGLYLRKVYVPKSTQGDGLYMKSGSGLSKVGSGLLLGPNSPFRNIPILGMIL